jgi:hypothetical protein
MFRSLSKRKCSIVGVITVIEEEMKRFASYLALSLCPSLSRVWRQGDWLLVLVRGVKLSFLAGAVFLHQVFCRLCNWPNGGHACWTLQSLVLQANEILVSLWAKKERVL